MKDQLTRLRERHQQLRSLQRHILRYDTPALLLCAQRPSAAVRELCRDDVTQ